MQQALENSKLRKSMEEQEQELRKKLNALNTELTMLKIVRLH